jgi:hypothetical protein
MNLHHETECAVKSAYLLILGLGLAVAGCGSNSGPSRPPEPPASRFIHSPPISRLSPEQLRALSMDCEKYSPDGTSRGPYDIAYCDKAVAAWGDSPLQMVTVPQTPIIRPDQVIQNSRPNDSARTP